MRVSDVKPCRLHVVSADVRWPEWVFGMLEKLLALPGVQWTHWTVLAGAEVPAFQQATLKLDARVFSRGRHADLASPVCERLRGQCPGPDRRRCQRVGEQLQLDAADLLAWREQGVDLMVWLPPYLPMHAMEGIAALGVWAVSVGGLRAATHPMAGAGEVAFEPHLALTRLLDCASLPPTVIYESVGAAVTNSLSRHRQRALAKAQAFMARCLRARQSDTAISTPMPALLCSMAGAEEPRVGAWSLAIRIARRIGRNRLERRRFHDQWQVAYSFDLDAGWDELERFQFLVPPTDCFWADPMPLTWLGRHYIYFEELPYRSMRGRLLVQEVSATGPVGLPLLVMEGDAHLSYPFLVPQGDALLMIPETAARRRVELHRCVEFPQRWELDAVLLEGVNAVDATVHQSDDGHWWMWVSVVEEGAERGEELHIYHADALRGPWTAHTLNPLVSDIRCARPAGPLSLRNGRLLRPAQNSAKAYGHHIEWMQVEELSGSTYRERQVERTELPAGSKALRMHTVASSAEFKVIDVMMRRER